MHLYPICANFDINRLALLYSTVYTQWSLKPCVGRCEAISPSSSSITAAPMHHQHHNGWMCPWDRTAPFGWPGWPNNYCVYTVQRWARVFSLFLRYRYSRFSGRPFALLAISQFHEQIEGLFSIALSFYLWLHLPICHRQCPSPSKV